MGSTFHTLWGLTEGERRRFAGGALALVCATSLQFLVPLVTRGAVDRVADGSATAAGLAAAGGLVLGLTVLAGLGQFLRGSLSAEAAERVARRLRERLYDRLQRLPAAWHDRADTGDVVQRATSDVETVRLFLAVQVVEVVHAAAMIAVAAPLMLSVDVPMALASVVLLPVVFGFALVFFRRVTGQFRIADEAEGALTARLHEVLSGIRVVRAFGRAAHERARFAPVNAAFRDEGERLVRLLASYWSVSDLLCLCQVGLALGVGAERVRAGTLGVGSLFAFLSWSALLTFPLRHLGRVLSDLGKGVVAAGRIGELLAEPEEPRGGTGGAPAPARLAGRIELRDVRFAYRGGPPALAGLTLEVRPGETLGILGPPGSGKSALAHLLVRLYDHDAGEIRLDGHDIRSLDRGFVRSQVGVVLQEPFLFSRTLRENVTAGAAGASDAEVAAAARAACLDDAVAGFERGWDTPVGERGVTLSGGQRSRVALARVLLRDPAVLVLDDALAAVDTRTEARIREVLQARRGRRTTLLISHRLTTLAGADRIVVLEAGRVVEEGTHAELLAAGGRYRRLWRIQGMLEEELREELGEGA